MDERSKQGARITVFGFCCNLLLAGLKFFVGLGARSISIMADATNNLMDSFSSFVSLICFRLSGRKADKEHPYGHGRYEYLAGVFVSILVIFVGLSFLRGSLDRIFYPEQIRFQMVSFLLLLASIAVKGFMGLFYLRAGRRMDSLAIRAAALDSFSDVAVTAVTAAAFLSSPFTSFPVDGVAGAIVALFVLVSGVRMLLETLHPLLGKAGDPNLIADILSLANSYDSILGVHDLLIHDYGPENTIVSLHAEMPETLSFVDCHRCINELEQKAAETLSVSLLVHADPVDVTDPEVQELHLMLKGILRSLDPALAYHDLQLDHSGSVKQLEMDLVIPYGTLYDGRENEIRETVIRELRCLDSNDKILIHIDRG